MKTARIVFGFHAVQAKLRAAPDSVIEVLLDEDRHDARARALADVAQAGRVRLMRVPRARLDGISGWARHQGVVATVAELRPSASLEDLLDSLSRPALLLVLDGVTDPHNLGACLRVADAAGVDAVIAPRDRAAGLNALAAKAASGAAESVPYFMVTNLARTLDALKERGIWIAGADERGASDLYTLSPPEALAWVIGGEGAGMRRLTRERCDLLVRIPMHGAVASLNASVAAALCLFETRRRRAAHQSGS